MCLEIMVLSIQPAQQDWRFKTCRVVTIHQRLWGGLKLNTWDVSMIAVQVVLLFLSAYWLFISFFSFGTPKKLKDHAAQKRFLILIPAHNEADVVGHLLDNLNTLDYPKELYEICLIADHCDKDKTAEIGWQKGVTVLEHWYGSEEPRGKPHALKYAIDYYTDRLKTDFDGVCIFDADNLVSLNYLREMNNHMFHGERLIQCYLDSKNPEDNWVSLGYATSYYFMNRTWQLGKYRLKLGNAIGGTGFCVDASLLVEVGWTAKSLTEDLEFTMQCLLRGVYATWSHHARVYDEKPTGFKVSVIQRLRWSRGHWDVCFRYVFRLIWRGIRHLDLRSLDGAIYLLNPGKSVIAFMVSVMLHISFAMEFFGVNMYFGRYILPWWLWLGTLAFNLFCIFYSSKVDTPDKRGLTDYILMIPSFFLFNLVYIALFFAGITTSYRRVWTRTDHSRTITISDIPMK